MNKQTHLGMCKENNTNSENPQDSLMSMVWDVKNNAAKRIGEILRSSRELKLWAQIMASWFKSFQTRKSFIPETIVPWNNSSLPDGDMKLRNQRTIHCCLWNKCREVCKVEQRVYGGALRTRSKIWKEIVQDAERDELHNHHRDYQQMQQC